MLKRISNITKTEALIVFFPFREEALLRKWVACVRCVRLCTKRLSRKLRLRIWVVGVFGGDGHAVAAVG
jgi:hypothetical protein